METYAERMRKQGNKQEMETSENLSIDDFKSMIVETWDKHAPIKRKVVRGNNAPFMNKTLSKAFMKRSRLKNRYHKFPTEENKNEFKKYRNFCVGLLKREKKKYFDSLDVKIMDDNKEFWKKIKPMFSGKSAVKSNITLIDGDNVLTNKSEVAETFNNYFTEVVQNLEIEKFPSSINVDYENAENVIDMIILKYENHPSVLKIKEHTILGKKFTFEETSLDIVYDKIKSLDPKKAQVENDIPAKVLIGINDIVSEYIKNAFNNAIATGKFPKSLKMADVIPIYKELERTLKNNYRPVSLLPIVSKIFEDIMNEQILAYMEKFLSAFIFAYRKRHGHQYCLVVMIEMWKKALDEDKVGGAILTDLSKAFDCISHELLIAKLHAYGFDKSALIFIFDYLKDRTSGKT